METGLYFLRVFNLNEDAVVLKQTSSQVLIFLWLRECDRVRMKNLLALCIISEWPIWNRFTPLEKILPIEHKAEYFWITDIIDTPVRLFLFLLHSFALPCRLVATYHASRKWNTLMEFALLGYLSYSLLQWIFLVDLFILLFNIYNLIKMINIFKLEITIEFEVIFSREYKHILFSIYLMMQFLS